MLRAVFTALFFFIFNAALAMGEPQTLPGCQGYVERSQLQSVADSETWRRLLHFRNQLFNASSEADGPLFFLSPQGRHSANAELEATLKALCADEVREIRHDHIQNLRVRCQFPARARFLANQFASLKWPEREACPELEHWRKKVRPQKISLVFSSYYANNPSSVFGHTLLRADPTPLHPQLPVSPLLSYGINFAAEVGTKNPVLYAVGGMMGRFPGKFAALPYYYKVREYSDFDSRDLWEYELELSAEEREQLIDHLWELGFTHFDYYYFSENCSYQLMNALEAAVPRMRAAEQVPYWAIPADTVKATVEQNGFLGRVSFRPSLQRQFEARKARLAASEEEALTEVILERRFKKTEHQSPEKQALVLDAALDYWDFKYTRELALGDSDKGQFKQELLTRRAKAPMTPPLSFDSESLDRPDQSHGSMRYGLTWRSLEPSKSWLGADLRFALHDFLDPQDGYPRTARIEFFHFQADLAHSPRLRSFDFFDVQLLAPIHADDRHWSWRANLGADRRTGFGCDSCMAARGEILGGVTLGFLRDRVLVFALAGGEGRWGGRRMGNERARLAPEYNLGTRIGFTRRWNALIEYEREFPLGPGVQPLWQAEAELRYAPRLDFSIGLGLQMSGENDADDTFIHLYHYR